MIAAKSAFPAGDEGFLPERFRSEDIDGFNVDAYLNQRAELQQGNIPLAETQTIHNSVDSLFQLCGWEDGPVQVDNFPCITGLRPPTPWSLRQGADIQEWRARFLKSIASLPDIRRLSNKGWLTHADAIDAFYLMAERQPDIFNELNQHDALLFGWNDPSIDVRKAMLSGQAHNLLGGLKFTYAKHLDAMRLEPNNNGEMKYSVQGFDIQLQTNGTQVFPPSHTGMLFAENIRVQPGDSCFDVGTGSGILGIVMAQAGGVVKESDTDETSVRYAKENAEKNGVGDAIATTCGAFFAGAAEGEQFDVIVANLPQTPAEAAGERSFGHALDGGDDGVSILEQFLDIVIAEKRLKPDGKLYICAASIANSTRLRDIISTHFSCKKVAEQYIPIPKTVEQESIGYLAELNRQGINDIVRLGDRQEWYSKDTLLELRLAA